MICLQISISAVKFSPASPSGKQKVLHDLFILKFILNWPSSNAHPWQMSARNMMHVGAKLEIWYEQWPQPTQDSPPTARGEVGVPVYSLSQGRAHNRRQLHENMWLPLCCAALARGNPCGGGWPSAPKGSTLLPDPPALPAAPHAGLLTSRCRTCLPGHCVCRPPSDLLCHTRVSCWLNRRACHCEQNAMFRFFNCFLV